MGEEVQQFETVFINGKQFDIVTVTKEEKNMEIIVDIEEGGWEVEAGDIVELKVDNHLCIVVEVTQSKFHVVSLDNDFAYDIASCETLEHEPISASAIKGCYNLVKKPKSIKIIVE